MATAYLLITCELGKEGAIIDELKRLDAVKEVNAALGSYDIIAKLESPMTEEIRNTITSKIRKIQNIRSTLTLMKLDSKG